MVAKGFVGSTVAGMLTSSGGPDGGFGTVASILGGVVDGGFKVGGEAAATEAEAPVIIEGSTGRTFYTAQNEAHASRLQSGGIPWPTEPTRAHLGEGLYSWGSRSQAEAYQSVLESHGVSGLNILEARIPQAQYQSLRSLDLRGLSDEAAGSWLESHSSLFGAGKPHGLDHVIRETGNFGPEYFFSKDVFPFFQIK